ncbi:hypothetical protein CSKR_113038 [Clonorchis sinensis]|uniref:Uncharacterized protein n=1 Tax=Clonorchis sinensis TaxID=79923 RepID=A0A3R7GTH1_CLOSI|nr:hypothetical protein CSKR_113038 [Clonorchis sinensis]
MAVRLPPAGKRCTLILVPKPPPTSFDALLHGRIICFWLLTSGPFKKRKGVLATRSAKRASYDVHLDRSTESQNSVSRKSVCVRVSGSKEELLEGHRASLGMPAPVSDTAHCLRECYFGRSLSLPQMTRALLHSDKCGSPKTSALQRPHPFWEH